MHLFKRFDAVGRLDSINCGHGEPGLGCRAAHRHGRGVVARRRSSLVVTRQRSIFIFVHTIRYVEFGLYETFRMENSYVGKSSTYGPARIRMSRR